MVQKSFAGGQKKKGGLCDALSKESQCNFNGDNFRRRFDFSFLG
jgi:hypothetical protein